MTVTYPTEAEVLVIEQTIAESLVADPPETVTPIDQRVLCGVAFLDAVMPDWADRIDLGTFRLSSAQHCVLAQLHGDYEAGMIEYSGTVDWAVGHGFYVDGDFAAAINTDSTFWESYRALELDWRTVIAARQQLGGRV